jgi:hypothetical protein
LHFRERNKQDGNLVGVAGSRVYISVSESIVSGGSFSAENASNVGPCTYEEQSGKAECDAGDLLVGGQASFRKNLDIVFLRVRVRVSNVA